MPRSSDDFHIGHHDADLVPQRPRTRSYTARERGVPFSPPPAYVLRVVDEGFNHTSMEEEHIYAIARGRLIANINFDEQLFMKLRLWADLRTYIDNNLGWETFCTLGVICYYTDLILEFITSMAWEEDEEGNDYINFRVRDEPQKISW